MNRFLFLNLASLLLSINLFMDNTAISRDGLLSLVKKLKVVLPGGRAMDETTTAPIEDVVRKRRLLFISTQSLFGTGIISLIEEQKEKLVIEKVAEAKMALEICGTFKPDVVVDLRETSDPEDQSLLQVLGSRYHTRVVHCTLKANHLTIYDRTRIKNATVEDLISAVLK
jgi:hypothetical protein